MSLMRELLPSFGLGFSRAFFPDNRAIARRTDDEFTLAFAREVGVDFQFSKHCPRYERLAVILDPALRKPDRFLPIDRPGKAGLDRTFRFFCGSRIYPTPAGDRLAKGKECIMVFSKENFFPASRAVERFQDFAFLAVMVGAVAQHVKEQ